MERVEDVTGSEDERFSRHWSVKAVGNAARTAPGKRSIGKQFGIHPDDLTPINPFSRSLRRLHKPGRGVRKRSMKQMWYGYCPREGRYTILASSHPNRPAEAASMIR